MTGQTSNSQYYDYLRLSEQDRDRKVLQRRASAWLFIFMISSVFGAMMIGIVWGRNTYGDPQMPIFAMGTILLGVGVVGVIVNIFRWRDADLLGFADDDDDEPERDLPAGQPQRITFNQTHAPGEVETEAVQNQTLPNQISRVPYQFNRDQWLALVHSLCPNPTGTWRWNKKNLRRARIFTVPIAGENITATGVYGRICSNFERAEIIEYKRSKWVVTEPGKNSLCVAAGLEVIPW